MPLHNSNGTTCFSAIIKIKGANPYVYVAKRRAASIKSGWRKPMPLLVRINGKPDAPWRINMVPSGNGSFYLYLHGAVRKASNTKVGDKVNVEAQFDSGYKNGPQHPMPEEFLNGLSKNLDAKKNWEALSPSRKKEVLRYFAALKSAEAKSRNMTLALNALSGKRIRFLGRAWKNGK